ncbi:hypothetical protein HK105_206070 [Polyrhizophydium stewartii]|uniref:Kinesin-like protein n=1 Tax=Polyrhizophydium stewartii TaxID=2732419 RepID=A0ABR4N4U4_9FUNG
MRPADHDASTIRIYARVRPRRPNSKLVATPGRYWTAAPAVPDGDPDSPDSHPRIGFHVPRDEHAGLVNNQRDSYEFKFDRVFDVDASQEEVFDVVAKPVIQSSLEGYNGTIFAYGQTGSGKTFTITGGAERYADRGLIPRTLQFLFKEAERTPGVQYSFHISYLEIYNEVGYDLLDSSRDAKRLEDLPKVTLQEDADEMIHLRNLGVVQAANVEEALNLLFVGDTNRMIAETPSNPSSSRSHCVFIIGITSRRSGEDVIRRSKLHLVDLAGSERVSRTGIDGTLLKEAKYINLSLHYLEQVIVALHEQALGKRSHIPYRNSMMTSVLRDSLGGNCKTTMIATVAVEDQLIDESISTCRFAQRVALISNKATLNEELDPQLVIARLKREIARLRAELALARGESGQESSEDLPEYEKERVKQAVDDFLADSSLDAGIIMADFRKIQFAFRVLKTYLSDSRQNGGPAASATMQPTGKSELAPSASRAITDEQDSSARSMTIDTHGLTRDQLEQFEKLKLLVAHRDNEINILVGMIAQLKAQGGPRRDDSLLPAGTSPARHRHHNSTSQLEDQSKETSMMNAHSAPAASSIPPYDSSTSLVSTVQTAEPTITVKSLERMTVSKPNLAASIPSFTTEKARAFEIFRRGYPSSEWIDGQKSLLKAKYSQAKTLGEAANQLRAEIKALKERLAAPAAVSLHLGADQQQDAEAARIALSDRVAKYKQAYQTLKDLKLEIEHLQHLLEQARHRLTRDFEHWYINVYVAAADQDVPSSMAPSSPAPPKAPLAAATHHDSSTDLSRTASDSAFLTAPAAGAAALRQTVRALDPPAPPQPQPQQQQQRWRDPSPARASPLMRPTRDDAPESMPVYALEREAVYGTTSRPPSSRGGDGSGAAQPTSSLRPLSRQAADPVHDDIAAFYHARRGVAAKLAAGSPSPTPGSMQAPSQSSAWPARLSRPPSATGYAAGHQPPQ